MLLTTCIRTERKEKGKKIADDNDDDDDDDDDEPTVSVFLSLGSAWCSPTPSSTSMKMEIMTCLVTREKKRGNKKKKTEKTNKIKRLRLHD